MILAIDVGNTTTHLGIYRMDGAAPVLLHHWSISTDRARTSDEYAILLRSLFLVDGIEPKMLRGVIAACVVPPMIPTLERMCRSLLAMEPLLVRPGVRTGMPVQIENPHEVGADRIVNAVAAYARYGGPLIIVDFGTATSYCVISAQGVYLGGAIAPGVTVATEALFAKAAKLPRIEIVKPARVIGKNTVAAMQSGIVYGFAGQVEGIVERLKAEIGEPTRVIATGEMAPLIAPLAPVIDQVELLLALEGLAIIYQRATAIK
ncbi:type III pantothenate kinase [Heliophilum fasciatum]|uniref:Type III pantothenate kinase n=1 Tax=Heliophilum fasciatum TaxID=35700 RepID=A0A4R2RZR8_9FIRM|nr:type III pantothenate kinase [Heliophilum fasciatum]MCW2277077.1 type III pantothenate kinase [Heliophilum fasciatum]TCP68397.1 pantothenate kinase [Heliophilum fasciatum]